ncbi:MAG: prephenate dehydrogenase [Candidatus Nanopelagicales bacterium]
MTAATSGTPAVLVIGTGLIGTSLGLAARAAGYEVLLADTDPAHVALAVAAGAGTALAADRVQDLPPSIVVIAVPPSAAADVAAVALADFPTSTVTDVSSVKAPVIARLAAAGADLSRFVGGHPMAGRETSGPAAATAELFRGRPWLLTPDAAVDADRVDQVRRFAESTGAVVRLMPAEVHDRAVALTSHAPQVVSSVMAARLADADPVLVAVAGQGLRDVTRIAASDPGLWSDILATNAVEVLPVVAGVQHDLAEVADALAEAVARARSSGAPIGSGGARIAAVVAAGNRGAAALPAKHGGAAASYSEVLVEVPDEPGALGELFLAAGHAGINLEDVRIEHTVGRLTAIAHLYVLPAAAEALRLALHGRWPVLD